MKVFASHLKIVRLLLPAMAGAVLPLSAATPAPAGLQFSATNFTAGEASRVVRVTVRRTGALTGSVSGEITTRDGSAAAGSDYASTNFPVILGPGVATASFPITLIPDTINEPAERFNVALTGTNVGPREAATVTILDNDPAGIVSLRSRAFSVSETSAVARVEILRTAGTASDVSVQLITQAGTADEGADYRGVNTSVTFGAGELKKTIEIPIRDDHAAEGNETVNILLRDPAGGARMGASSNAVLTIVDDETAISFSRPGYAASESSGTVPVTILRSGPLKKVVTVEVVSTGGSAIAGLDYKPVSNVVTFAAGVAAKVIPVKVLNDTLDDGDRTVTLTLRNPSTNAQLGSIVNTFVTIADNDSAGVISFSSTNYTVVESARKALITVRRTGGTASGVSVYAMVFGGTATSDVDFTSVFTNLVFNAGEVTKTIVVPIATDTLLESTEYALMQLAVPLGGATIGWPSVALLNIQNAPDPDAVPLAGSPFLKGTINGKSFGASGMFLQSVYSDYKGGPMLDNMVANAVAGLGGIRMFTISGVRLSGLGPIYLSNAGNNGLVTYTETSGVGGRLWDLAGGSLSAGTEGTITIDGLDIANKKVSGRFNLKLRETTGNVAGGFINAVGSFRTVMH